MKAFSLFMAILPLAAYAAAPADTVKTITDAHSVVVTEDSLGTHFDVVGAWGDSTYHYAYTVHHAATSTVSTSQTEDHDISFRLPFSKTDTTRASRACFELECNGLYFNFGLGWPKVGSQSPEIKEKMGHQYEGGILNLLGVVYNTGHGQQISLGFGLECRYFNLHAGGLFGNDEDGNLTIDPIPDGAVKVKSNLQIFSLQFPLLFRQDFADCATVFAGGIMMVNTGAHLSNRYKLGDVTHNDEVDGILRRKVSFDIIGGLTWDSLGAYVRWRPQSVLCSGILPEMSTLSVGLIIGF